MSETKNDSIAAATVTAAAAYWQAGFDSAVQKANEALLNFAKGKATATGQLQGNLAEFWHSGTFNIDAYKKGFTNLFAETLTSNAKASPDIVLTDQGSMVENYQLKYYKTGQATARQLSNPDYSKGAKIVPSDQLRTVKDHSRRIELKNTETRPHVSEAAQHTQEQTSDRLEHKGVESKPLGRRESSEMTEKARDRQDVIKGQDFLSGKEVLKKSLQGGAVAAGLGFARGALPHLIKAFKAYRAGHQITDEEFLEHLKQAGSSGAKSGAAAGLQGAVGTALVHAGALGHLGEHFKALGPGPIGVLSVVVFKSISDGYELYQGKLDKVEFARRCATTAIVSSAGLIGQTFIPIPFLGAFIGSTIGGLVAKYGLAVAQWTFTKLSELFDYLGGALFAWDLIHEAREQSQRIEQFFEELGVNYRETRAASLRAFEGLEVDRICLASIQHEAEQEQKDLEELERASRELFRS